MELDSFLAHNMVSRITVAAVANFDRDRRDAEICQHLV